MSIYDINGDLLISAYDINGDAITSAYDITGDDCFSQYSGYYEDVFNGYVDDYIAEYGLYIDGTAVTEDQLKEYMLNRNNCIYRGKLSKSGQYIVDQNGNNIDIQGIGTHHLTQYSNLHTIANLKALKYCGVNCIRLSAYLNDHYFAYSDDQLAKGYLTEMAPIKAEMDKIIGYCVQLGLYAIVDWHVFSGGGETLNTSSAVAFFTYFASKYYNCPNVLYELANEPFSDSLADIVNHCKLTSQAIKTYVNNPVLICGVRTNASELYDALQAENIDDIFISQHRYTGESGVNVFQTYWNNGIPLFVSEWSNVRSNGQGDINIGQGTAFLEFFHENHIPHCIWKYTDQTAVYSTLTNRGNINSEYYRQGALIEEDYSDYGKFFFDIYGAYSFTS